MKAAGGQAMLEGVPDQTSLNLLQGHHLKARKLGDPKGGQHHVALAPVAKRQLAGRLRSSSEQTTFAPG